MLVWIGLLAILCWTFVSSFISTLISQKLALRLNILDDKNSAPERKLQAKPIPLAGSLGLVLTALFFIGISWITIKIGYWVKFNNLELGQLNNFFFQAVFEYLTINLSTFKLYWLFVASLLILVSGVLDDKFQFRSKIMILPTTIALLITVFLADISITSLSSQFLFLLPENILTQRLLAAFWIGLCLSATKFLDGHDGLVTTVGIIAFLTIASISSLPHVAQPFIVLCALIWAVSLIGFLPFNFPEAKLYLGDSGSQLIGYWIGVLSILSGAKIATTASILGWFILDIIIVMIIRLAHKQNPLKGDRRHWHHRLSDAGLNKIQVLAITAFFLINSAILAIILPTTLKIYIPFFQVLILSLSWFWIGSKLTTTTHIL